MEVAVQGGEAIRTPPPVPSSRSFIPSPEPSWETRRWQGSPLALQAISDLQFSLKEQGLSTGITLAGRKECPLKSLFLTLTLSLMHGVLYVESGALGAATAPTPHPLQAVLPFGSPWPGGSAVGS